MSKRRSIDRPDDLAARIPGREDDDRETPRGRLVRRLMTSAGDGKAFLWIWSLVVAALFALSFADLFAKVRPNGLDFSESG